MRNQRKNNPETFSVTFTKRIYDFSALCTNERLQGGYKTVTKRGYKGNK